jgi:hypothetical protein
VPIYMCINVKLCGVYSLLCLSCDQSYVGQTGRSFRTQFDEHITDTTKINPRMHCICYNITMSTVQLKKQWSS